MTADFGLVYCKSAASGGSSLVTTSGANSDARAAKLEASVSNSDARRGKLDACASNPDACGRTLDARRRKAATTRGGSCAMRVEPGRVPGQDGRSRVEAGRARVRVRHDEREAPHVYAMGRARYSCAGPPPCRSRSFSLRKSAFSRSSSACSCLNRAHSCRSCCRSLSEAASRSRQ